MAFYEAQSWQVPARTGSWEQPPPPSRSGMRWQNHPTAMAFPDCVTGTNSVQREDTNAFDMQIEGKLKTCYRGTKWQDGELLRHLVASFFILRKGVRPSSLSSTDRFPSDCFFWTPLEPFFFFLIEKNIPRGWAVRFFSCTFLIYSLNRNWSRFG